ncbi:MAG: T9SS type A sorting domain-containing protein, partial [Flavobacteriales bacterium]|nr:T9SS type A sorting domain-containing protein [Flavobacteriales bacterium]
YFQGSPWMPIVNTVTVIDNTTLMANITVPDSVITGLGMAQVSYFTQSSGSYNFAMVDAFSVTNANEAKIIDVTPGTAVSGQTLDVTITGMGTRFTEGIFTQGSATSDVSIYFNIPSFHQGSSSAPVVNSMSVISNTQLIANITIPDSAVSGFVDGYVYYNTATWDSYLYPIGSAFNIGGMISSVSPGVLYQGQSATLSFDFGNTAIASNFRFWLSNNSLGCLEEIFPTSTSITGNTISANLDIPANALTGWWDIKVTNHGDGMITGRGLVQIVDINTMGAIESGNHSQLHIYPNPMTYNTTLSFNNDDGSAYSLVAYDVLGKQVLAQEHITENKVVLEKGSLDRGVYIIVLQGLENTYRGRLVVD